MSLSKTMLIGFLGDDLKMHHFDGGGCIGRFPLATNETYTKKSTNEKVTETEWHNIVVRNKQAEVIEKYVKKGDQIYVEGKIKTLKWQDKDGKDRYTTEIHVFAFSFINNKSSVPSPQTTTTTTNQSSSGNGYTDTGDHDDLPF